MKVLRLGDLEPTVSDSPIFAGAVERCAVVDEGMASLLRLALVRFSPGAHTVLHSHSNDQVLVVTEGRGILATEGEENPVEPGAIIFVPAGERHWHGARADSWFAHISITTPGKTELYGG